MAVPPPPSDAHARRAENKVALRRRLRATRQAHVEALSRDGMAHDQRLLCERLYGLIHGHGHSIGGYAAHRGEPAIFDVLERFRREGRIVALPRAGADGAMRFVGWRADDGLPPGLAGIAEPADGDEIVPDTLLVPLLGFDRGGGRLGQGGGYYDRWLARHPHVQTIGVAWSVQEVPAVPIDPWDMPLALIVTERETIRP